MAHSNLGVALARQGKLEEAILHFSRTVQINQSDEMAHYNLGLAYYKLGQLDQAIAEFRTTLQINPDSSVAREALENASRKKNKKG